MSKTSKAKNERAALLEELKISDGMLQSRWSIVHGPNGLAATLVKSIQAMQEIRMVNEYGDYLAIACAELNTLCGGIFGSSKIPIWKARPEMDWQAVAAAIEEEREDLEESGDGWTTSWKGIEKVKTPFLDDIRAAAKILETPPGQIEFEITEYAKRNSFCHTGIKTLIDECRWEELARKTLYDLQALAGEFATKNQKYEHLRNIIKDVQKKYFMVCKLDNKGKVIQIDSEYAREKKIKMITRQSSRASLRPEGLDDKRMEKGNVWKMMDSGKEGRNGKRLNRSREDQDGHMTAFRIKQCSNPQAY